MDNLSFVNQDPYGRGWLVKVRPNESKQLEQLLYHQAVSEGIRRLCGQVPITLLETAAGLRP